MVPLWHRVKGWLFATARRGDYRRRVSETQRELNQAIAMVMMRSGEQLLEAGYRESDPEKRREGLRLLKEASKVSAGETSFLVAVGAAPEGAPDEPDEAEADPSGEEPRSREDS